MPIRVEGGPVAAYEGGPDTEVRLSKPELRRSTLSSSSRRPYIGGTTVELFFSERFPVSRRHPHFSRKQPG